MRPRALTTLGGETMGTSWSVKLFAAPPMDLHALHHAIQRRLDTVVEQMSNWRPDSDISRFNRAPADTWHALPDDFYRVLSTALEIARHSGGAFDPSVGSLVGLWGFGANAGPRRAPEADALRAAQQQVGWQGIGLRRPTREAWQPGVQLDLSAIAKGFGADVVAALLRAREVDSALVEVGGELIGYGRKSDGSPWRVLVEAAGEESEGEPRVLDLDAMAVATSGDRWHGYEHDGRHYSHSIDPRSGRPVEHAVVSVTVLASEAMRADAWATALTVMGAQAGLAFAQAHGLAARFVQRQGDGLHETMTEAFRRQLTP